MDNKIKTVLFDFDGTLIDQFDAIHECFNYALGELGFEPISMQKVKDSVGGALSLVMKEYVGEENIEKAIFLFRKHFEEVMLDNFSILPGAQWLLQSLHKEGYKIALFTNKPTFQSKQMCEAVGFDVYFDEIIGTLDTPYIKPQKEFSEHALNKMSSSAQETVLIGDSHYDVEAAASVGMRVHTVTTGSHTKERLEGHHVKPTTIHKDLYELGEAIFGLKAPVEATQA